MKAIFVIAALYLGIAIFNAGVFLIYRPAGFMTTGICLVLIALLSVNQK